MNRMLTRLLPSQDVDALLGDITEEARHRSRLWYWAQILAVIVVGSWKDIRAHVWLALRTGALTVALLGAFFFVQFVPFFVIFDSTFRFTWPVVQPAIWACAFVGTGWIVARVYRRHGIAMVLAGAGAIPAAYVGLFSYVAFAIGWQAFVSHMSVWSLVYSFFGQPLLMIAGGWLAMRPQEAA